MTGGALSGGALTGGVLALIVFCILAETLREVCFKAAAGRAQRPRDAYLSPLTLVGVLFWAVELIVWARVLVLAPLSLAFPVMCASYATIALAGAVLFHERITRRHAVGIALVTVGVAAIGASAGI